MKVDVFISYSSKDKTIADAICSGLEQAKIRCWIAPRDIIPGQVYGEAIVAAINNCKVTLLIYSANSNASIHVLREVERAVSRGKIVVPFRIENAKMSDAMEYFLSAPHWLDAITPPLEENISKLIMQLYKILGIEMDENSMPVIKVKEKKKKLLPIIISCCCLAIIAVAAIFYFSKKENIQSKVTHSVEKKIPVVASTVLHKNTKNDSIITKEKQIIEKVNPIKTPPIEKKIDNTILNMALAEYTGATGNIDFNKAEELFKEAAKADNPLAKMWIALLHFNGQCNFEKSVVKAATIANSVFPEVEKNAKLENDNAAYLMGIAYQKGLTVEKNDGKAAEWFAKSAEKNNPLALYSLGLMYADGQNVSKDDKKAVDLLQKAAKKGHVISMYYMGLMLKTGRGIKKDDKQSAVWFKKAAQKGHSKSMYVLGSLYEKGSGIQKDHLEALNWWKKAAKKGNKNAQSQLKGWNQTW